MADSIANPYGDTTNDNTDKKESILNIKDKSNDNNDDCDFPKA